MLSLDVLMEAFVLAVFIEDISIRRIVPQLF